MQKDETNIVMQNLIQFYLTRYMIDEGISVLGIPKISGETITTSSLHFTLYSFENEVFHRVNLCSLH